MLCFLDAFVHTGLRTPTPYPNLSHPSLSRYPLLCTLTSTGVDLSKILGMTKIFGDRVSLTEGVSQLFWARDRAAPLKSTTMLSSCIVSAANNTKELPNANRL